jgi:hypothetical protein
MQQVVAKMPTPSKVAHSNYIADTACKSVRPLRPVRLVNRVSSHEPSSLKHISTQTQTGYLRCVSQGRCLSDSPSAALEIASKTTRHLKTIFYQIEDMPTAPLPPVTRAELPSLQPSSYLPVLPSTTTQTALPAISSRLKTVFYERENLPTTPLPSAWPEPTDHQISLQSTPNPSADTVLEYKNALDEEKSLTWQNGRAWRDYSRDIRESFLEPAKPERTPSMKSLYIAATVLVFTVLLTSFVLSHLAVFNR